MSLSLQPVLVETGCPDEEGCLIFVGGKLAAVLVRLSPEHGARSGRWFVEKGFGRFDGPSHPIFPDVEAAQDWISLRMQAADASRTPRD
jgi:hypothetical protein